MSDEGAHTTAAENIGRGDVIWVGAEIDPCLPVGYYRVESVSVGVTETTLAVAVSGHRHIITVGSVDDILVRRLKT